MFYLVIAAWIVGVGISYYYVNRVLPTIILLIGIAAIALHFTVGLGYFFISIMAILNVIIWIANKMDMS